MENEDLKEINRRLAKLEEWKTLVDIYIAKEEVNKEYIKQRFDLLEKNLNEFKDRISAMSNRFLWAIATPVITAIIGFAISGKLLP